MNTERQEVLQRACDFLGRREHSRKELQQKLARRCEDEVLIEELLDKLADEGLQSDERFTESFVHHRVNNGKGPLKIQQELSQRGVDQNLISIYLDSEDVDWLTLAKEVRTKKYGDDMPADYQKQALQSRFLYSRGFSSEHISRLFRTD
jgi:regulatory protein